MRAKYPSKCPYCGDLVKRGDEITKVEDDGGKTRWYHDSPCAPAIRDYYRALEGVRT